jgi:hypothetical protein
VLVTENERVELKKDREERYTHYEGVAYVSSLLAFQVINFLKILFLLVIILTVLSFDKSNNAKFNQFIRPKRLFQVNYVMCLP